MNTGREHYETMLLLRETRCRGWHNQRSVHFVWDYLRFVLEGSNTILEASSRLGVVRMIILNPDDTGVEVISLQRGKESLPCSHYRIRVKIDGKYYVGHLEMSE